MSLAERVAELKRVQSATTHYERLNLVQGSTIDVGVVKKAFMKMVKLLHPDKCHLPEATEVFQKVTQAKTVLENFQQRSIYDATLLREKQQRWITAATMHQRPPATAQPRHAEKQRKMMEKLQKFKNDIALRKDLNLMRIFSMTIDELKTYAMQNTISLTGMTLKAEFQIRILENVMSSKFKCVQTFRIKCPKCFTMNSVSFEAKHAGKRSIALCAAVQCHTKMSFTLPDETPGPSQNVPNPPRDPDPVAKEAQRKAHEAACAYMQQQAAAQAQAQKLQQKMAAAVAARRAAEVLSEANKKAAAATAAREAAAAADTKEKQEAQAQAQAQALRLEREQIERRRLKQEAAHRREQEVMKARAAEELERARKRLKTESHMTAGLVFKSELPKSQESTYIGGENAPCDGERVSGSHVTSNQERIPLSEKTRTDTGKSENIDNSANDKSGAKLGATLDGWVSTTSKKIKKKKKSVAVKPKQSKPTVSDLLGGYIDREPKDTGHRSGTGVSVEDPICID